MNAGWAILTAALLYLAGLFLVATFGDRAARRRQAAWPGSGGAPARHMAGRPTLYALSLAVYCTSWTFFGSVGLASASGWDFLGIYIGPILVFTLGMPLVRHIVVVSKTQRITSVADFISARYGKSQIVAMVATVIAVVASVPYIALQLKAVSASLTAVVVQWQSSEVLDVSGAPISTDLALFVAIAMALFAILFGTRHSDATEHQDGLMLAVAAESVIKLAAFLVVGIFVVFVLFPGPGELLRQAAQSDDILSKFGPPLHWNQLLIFSLLSGFAALLLPRQFHVTVVENNNQNELSRARWLFPLYLIVINLFVAPIAIAGQLLLGDGLSADMYVLALPLSVDAYDVLVIAFIGGLSAATAMVIVAAVALSIMISNQLVLPILLRGSSARLAERDMIRTVLNVRRVAIFAVLSLGYIYYAAAGNTAALASIGLLAFAAIAQLAPAFLGGLMWRRANARGAVAGMLAGTSVWAFTLLLPTVAGHTAGLQNIMADGLFGLSALRPQHLFGMELSPLTHGVLWSLAINLLAYIGVSLTRQPTPLERLQADSFVPIAPSGNAGRLIQRRSWRRAVTVGELKETIARYLGDERTERALAAYAKDHKSDLNPYVIADQQLVSHSEQLLASAVGAASSRLVFSLLMQRSDGSGRVPIELLDDASKALQYNRDLLQSALDHVHQGIAVFDKDLRLICWNQHFRSILGLPPEFGQVGTSLGDVVRFGVENGYYGAGQEAGMIDTRLRKLVEAPSLFEETLHPSGTVLEVRTNRMPDGGVVVTYTDVSERVAGKRALEQANLQLEQRVRVRTEELTTLNHQLEQASRMAQDANLSKTRFLAAAGHDILQPLNAARLYTSALTEQLPAKHRDGALHVDAALSSVEEIMGTLLEISKLDAGGMIPDITVFSLDDMLEQLRVEFQPMADGKALRFSVVKSGLYVRSDRALLRRLLQNLISNAIKYTETGRVLVGCRRGYHRTVLHVYDTGHGVPLAKQKAIFDEFQRLDAGIKAAPGLGLGLSIVERLSKILEHPIELRSSHDTGTRFSVSLPVATPVKLPVTKAKARPKRQTRLKGLLLLCIDNEPEILNGMRALLEGWGCQVITASDEAQALQVIEQERQASARIPDVVLLDYHLDGGKLGVDLMSRLRWRFDQDMPGILITADRSLAVRDEAEARQMQVLNKPLKPAVLRGLLQHLARPGKATKSAPPTEAAE